MYSYNSNLKKHFAKSRSESNMEKRNRKKYDKLEEECESYILKLRPPECEWFVLGSKRGFLGLKKVYYFYVSVGNSPLYRRSVKFAFRDFLSLREDISRWSWFHLEHLENIAEIIAKKKAEDALSSITSKAR